MKERRQGKVKTVYNVYDDPDKVLIEYKDKVTAGNGEKVDFPEGKGEVCCQISEWFFKKLELRRKGQQKTLQDRMKRNS